MQVKQLPRAKANCEMQQMLDVVEAVSESRDLPQHKGSSRGILSSDTTCQETFNVYVVSVTSFGSGSASAARQARMLNRIRQVSFTGMDRLQCVAGGTAHNSDRAAASVGLPLRAWNGSVGPAIGIRSRNESAYRNEVTSTQIRERAQGRPTSGSGCAAAAAASARRSALQHLGNQSSVHFSRITGASL